MPLYQSCIANSSIHPVDAWALNHQSWKLFPAATSTVVTNPREIRVPIGETIEKATAQSGIEISIAAMVAGGVKVAGKDFTPFFLSLSTSICAYPKSNAAIQISTPRETYNRSGYQEFEEISPVIATHAPAGASARQPPSHQWQSHVNRLRYG